MSPRSAGENVRLRLVQGLLVPTAFPLPAILQADNQPAFRPASTGLEFRQAGKNVIRA